MLIPLPDIFVPPEQVIDTVDLYFLRARQRRLSLRFLSWFILHQHIQTDNHDSIEDARSALSLYYAYQDLESEGMFDQKLEEIYKEGRQYVRQKSLTHSKYRRATEKSVFSRTSNLRRYQELLLHWHRCRARLWLLQRRSSLKRRDMGLLTTVSPRQFKVITGASSRPLGATQATGDGVEAGMNAMSGLEKSGIFSLEVSSVMRRAS